MFEEFSRLTSKGGIGGIHNDFCASQECPAGRWSAIFGAKKCDGCPAGRVSQSIGAAQCGRFNSMWLNLSALLCRCLCKGREKMHTYYVTINLSVDVRLCICAQAVLVIFRGPPNRWHK